MAINDFFLPAVVMSVSRTWLNVFISPVCTHDYLLICVITGQLVVGRRRGRVTSGSGGEKSARDSWSVGRRWRWKRRRVGYIRWMGRKSERDSCVRSEGRSPVDRPPDRPQYPPFDMGSECKVCPELSTRTSLCVEKPASS